jgi:hypothetical protein
MVRVNAELGFVVISEDQWWELRLEQLRAALGRRAWRAEIHPVSLRRTA